MISTLLDRLFQRSNVPSGAQVKNRLKFILAHDRAAIEPKVFENMRNEIMRVVSKYVELDEDSLDIRLESDKRMTALIANLPIRMVREELADLAILFDTSSEDLNLGDNSDSSALEMDMSAEAALDAIAAKESIKSAPEDISSEDIVAIAERTAEVSIKIRTAATKSQNGDIGDRGTVESEQKEENIIANTSSNSDNEELDEQPSDQLELSLGVPIDLKSQEVVVEESPELYNRASAD
jgi:cell division topological specificity factor